MTALLATDRSSIAPVTDRDAALERGAERRLPAGVATAVVVAVLALVNVTEHLLGAGLWFGPLVAVGLVGFARWTGLSWAELGLGADRVRSGSRWAIGAVAIVAGVYMVGVLLPFTRTAFLDARYHLPVPGALWSAFVIIPVGTVVVEEIAFRSVLWGALARHATTARVLLGSSLLFGLWHVLPSLHLASANQGVGQAAHAAGGSSTVLVVVATVAITTIGGVIAGELRRRSGSVLASVGMHWATNGLGVLFGLVAWRLAA